MLVVFTLHLCVGVDNITNGSFPSRQLTLRSFALTPCEQAVPESDFAPLDILQLCRWQKHISPITIACDMAESAAQELVGGSLPVGVNILLAQAQDPITASCDQYHSEMSPAALKDSNEGLYSPTLSSPKRQRTSTRKARASWQYEQLEDEPDEEEKEEMAKEEELQTGLPLLEMPFDVLTRVLSRLPLNLLLQASAVRLSIRPNFSSPSIPTQDRSWKTASVNGPRRRQARCWHRLVKLFLNGSVKQNTGYHQEGLGESEPDWRCLLSYATFPSYC